VKRCERETDPPVATIENTGPVPGGFRVVETRAAVNRQKQKIEVPIKVVWVPSKQLTAEEQGGWRLWQAPQQEHVIDAAEAEAMDLAQLERLASGGYRLPAGQYVIGGDPASGETDEKGVVHAAHALQVIDHRTRLQVAEWSGQIDPDLWALEALKAALYYNRAWVAIERTGGYGLSTLRLLSLDWHYPFVFTEQSKDRRSESRSDRLGFSTDTASKPLIEAHMMALLREGNDGVQSLELARQMLTFVRNERGGTGPEPGNLSDRLMAYMIAQWIAHLRPIRPASSASSDGKKRQRAQRRRRNPKTGY
jgi:hypothetical protein